jgi:hypothetical protein
MKRRGRRNPIGEYFQDSPGGREGRALSAGGTEGKLRALRPPLCSVKETGYVHDSPGGTEDKLRALRLLLCSAKETEYFHPSPGARGHKAPLLRSATWREIVHGSLEHLPDSLCPIPAACSLQPARRDGSGRDGRALAL